MNVDSRIWDDNFQTIQIYSKNICLWILLLGIMQRRLVGDVIRGRWVRGPDGLRGFGGRAPQPPEAKPGDFCP